MQPFRGKMDLELALACIRETFVFANWFGGREAHVLLKMPLASEFVCTVVVILHSTGPGVCSGIDGVDVCQWLILIAQPEQLEEPRWSEGRTRGLPAKTLRLPLDEVQLGGE